MKLLIFCGIPFSGKSVLSKELSGLYGLVRIDLDEVKKSLLGDVADEEVSQSQWDDVYNEMYKRVEEGLKQGRDVVQDAGNFTEYERGLVAKIGKKYGAKVITVFVDTPVEVAKKRWMENKRSRLRFDISEESLSGGIGEMQPPSGTDVVVIDGMSPIDEQLKQFHDKFLK